MTNDAQLDRLVDEIARRVQGRLRRGTGTAAPPARTDSTVERSCQVRRDGARQRFDKTTETSIATDLAAIIDHTLLKPEASHDELRRLCDEARQYGFATVCVNAANIRFCAALLEGSEVKPIAVVGFPLGASTPAAKAFEAQEAIGAGAQEIDTVINVGALKGQDYGLVLEDIRAVVSAAAPMPVKIILETGLLDHDQKVIACALARIAGAAFVKTSTGFGPGGATVEDVRLMRSIVGTEMGVKASGGVRTQEDARKMVEAGATRIGASSSVAIVTASSPSQGRKPGARRGGRY